MRRPRGDASVKVWISSAPTGEPYLSVLVIGEIRRGIELLRRTDPAQADTYESWLQALRRDYADRVLPITAEEWGRKTFPTACLSWTV